MAKLFWFPGNRRAESDTTEPVEAPPAQPTPGRGAAPAPPGRTADPRASEPRGPAPGRERAVPVPGQVRGPQGRPDPPHGGAPPGHPARPQGPRPGSRQAPQPGPPRGEERPETQGRARDPRGPRRTFEAGHQPREPRPEARQQRRAAPQDETVPGLAVYGVVKSYGGRPVVRGVNLSLQRGEVVGLLGPNGAGKTTVFYMITGLVPADDGRIELDGFDITRLPMYRRARLGIGYLPQEPSIFRGLTVEQNIRAVLEVAEPNRERRATMLEALLEEFGIERLRKARAIALSGGERRRVEIARALASQPSFMLLDEPFAGIDPVAVGDIRTLVRHLTSRGIGVLITDHNVRETLGLIDRAYIIHDGQVLMEGTPDEIVRNSDVRRVYLGDQFNL